MRPAARALCALAGALPLLPAPGRLLVESAPFGAAIVERTGEVRRLGEWYETSFSPSGSRIVGARGGQLAVLDQDGRELWSVRRTAAPAGMQPAWSDDGRRIAYRTASGLRVIGAGGERDRRVARALLFAGPRWRPGSPRQLAWVDRRGRVRLLDVLARRTLWRSSPGPPVRPGGLQWSANGKRLAAISGSQVRIFGSAGRLVRRLRAPAHDHFQVGTFTSGRRSRLVLVQHDFTRGRSRVSIVAGRKRQILVRRGSAIDVTPSPDGRYVLLGRRTADEWRFLPVVPGARTVVIEGVTRRLYPEAGGRWAFPRSRGWVR